MRVVLFISFCEKRRYRKAGSISDLRSNWIVMLILISDSDEQL